MNVRKEIRLKRSLAYYRYKKQWIRYFITKWKLKRLEKGE